MDLKGKRVTVVGLGKSGVAACNLLVKKGARVSITDTQDNPRIEENIRRVDKKKILDIEIGRHTEGLISGQDLVVTSPGLPPDALPIVWARQRGIPVIGEIELAFAFCPAPIIAITGTNGKTTVATLVGEIFRQAGKKYVVCGNIGNPFSEELPRITSEHTAILEVSSFQLETIDKFKPKIAVVLNLSSDHLDRYVNLDEYFAAKLRIFSNQDKQDWAIFNKEDSGNFRLTKIKAKVLYFSNDSKNKFLDKEFAGFNSNHFAALTISSLFAIPKKAAIDTCRQFKGIEHRMEEVTQIQGVKFINDSKATNVNSTLWALNFITSPIILIAGGRDKDNNFAAIREVVKKKVKSVVLIGEAKEKMRDAFGDLVLIRESVSLQEAVREAFCLAHADDCILLSPMCASFDMFSDYTERGRIFKEAVQNLVHSP